MSVKAGSHGRQGRNKDFAFTTGNLVLVKWEDGMVYFAKIKRIDTKKEKCTVVFDDKSQDEADFSQIHSVDETTTDIICIKCKKDNSDSPNEIVLCDMCGIGFHQKCHVPPIPASALQLDMPWNCSYCQQGVKCPFLTESLDVLQNLLSDDNEATSGDEEGGTPSQYSEVVQNDTSSRRNRKRKGKKTYESSLHARQDRRKSLRNHTPTPELSPLVTKNHLAAQSSPESKDTSADFTHPKKSIPVTDSDVVAEKSAMSRKRKKHHSVVHAKRMKRSSVESHTVSVTRINTPIYEEASINFFSSYSPESDEYPASKVMLSSAASSSPDKQNNLAEEPSASKEFPGDMDTIPETPLVDEHPPKIKQREFRVSLSLNPDIIEKGPLDKSRLKSPLLFSSTVPLWDEIISPKGSEKSPSIESSPGSVQQKTETIKEKEHVAFLASPLPTTSKNIGQAKRAGDLGISSTKDKIVTEKISSPLPSVDNDIVTKSVSAIPVVVGETKSTPVGKTTCVSPEAAISKPVSPTIPVDTGVPEPESASPPAPMDIDSPPHPTTVFSTSTHPSSITETIVVTSSTLMDANVTETKKISKPSSPICSSADAKSPSTTTTSESTDYGGLNFDMDVGVTGKAKARPSTLTTNPVAISSIKVSQSDISTSKAPTPKSISTITSKSVFADSKASSQVHKEKIAQQAAEITSKQGDSERANPATNGQIQKVQGAVDSVPTAKVTTTPPGKSPTNTLVKHEMKQSLRKSHGTNKKETSIQKKFSQLRPSVESAKDSVVAGSSTGAPTPVITAPPQTVSREHQKQMGKSDREPSTNPSSGEMKPPIAAQTAPTAETALSQRLEEIVSRATLGDEGDTHVGEPDVIITAVEKKAKELPNNLQSRQTKEVGTSTLGKQGPKASSTHGQVSQFAVSQTSPLYANQSPVTRGSVVQPVFYQVQSAVPSSISEKAPPQMAVQQVPKERLPLHTTSTQPGTHMLYSANGAALSHPVLSGGSPQPKSIIHHPSSGAHVYYSAVPTDSMLVAKSGVHPSSVATTKPYAIVNAIPTQASGDVNYRPVTFPEKVLGVAEGVADGGNKHHHAVQMVQTAGRVAQLVPNQNVQPGRVLSPEVSSTTTASLVARPPPSYTSFVNEKQANKSSAIDEDLQSIQKKIGDAFTQSSEVMLVSAFEEAWKKFQANDRVYKGPKEKGASASTDKPFPPNITIEPSNLVHQMSTKPRLIAPMPSSEKIRGPPAVSQRPTTVKYVHTVATAPDGSQQQVALQPVGNTTMVYAIPATHAGKHVHVAGLYYPTVETTAAFNQQSAPEHQPTAKHTTVARSLPPQQQHHHHHRQSIRVTSHKPRGSGETRITTTQAGGGKPQNKNSGKKTSNCCARCGESATYVCSGCRTEWYCSRDCQLKCWENHSEVCAV